MFTGTVIYSIPSSHVRLRARQFFASEQPGHPPVLLKKSCEIRKLRRILPPKKRRGGISLRKWRKCPICGNRTRSVIHLGYVTYFLSIYPFVFCGNKCSAFGQLLPKQELVDRIIRQAMESRR